LNGCAYILFYESVKEKETKIPNEQLMNKEYFAEFTLCVN
jgi:hypothetical protein